MMRAPAAKSPTVREANVGRTKQAILKAAQTIFATCGYAEAGVRDIAAKARVNPALIARYYGSKAKLFEAALESSVNVSLFTSTDRARFGEAVVEEFVAATPKAALTVPLLLFAAGDTEARAIALRILKRKVAQPLALWFGGDDAMERAAQLIAVVTGFYTYRLMLPLDPFKGEASPATRAWLAKALQEIVDR